MNGQALLVVDMMEDFISPGGALAIGESAGDVTRAAAREIAVARDGDVPVIYICDNHRPGDAEFSMFPPHCMAGTKGAQVVEPLKPQPGDYVVLKRRYSAFFCTDLDLILRELEAKTVKLVGVCTNICILYTAAGARMRGYEVKIAVDAVASFNRAAHDFSLQEMETSLGVKLER